ncbi:ABC transporter ATP-binding protein [Lipingzhangella sp. LS1_29]|uniref:ABC transporter ATP-binding protein n=1 Tax=Lipingzhangella rawalii TaxID=2055835 RepID=A0ABU2H314_9ACTN|nr:ABC transporter ATP-binding protein [Lipingzhangella rawalii]MDS1269244.1 ABC transporter ATP-binding protein [Lipingzhangella rawalii]
MQGSSTAWSTFRSFARDREVAKQRLRPGTVSRVAAYARPYARQLVLFLLLTAVAGGTVVATPLLMKAIIDEGVVPGNSQVVVALALALAVLALVEAVLTLAQRWFSARIGEGLIFDLRTEVFAHVQRMSLAFFTRTQTGALISRLNTDVIGAQRALTTTLSTVVSNVISLVLVLGTMLVLSWQITLLLLLLLPVFVVPAKIFGRKLAAITRESMRLDAEMSALMTERFTVGGAMLVKLYGRPEDEVRQFSDRAARVRDIGVVSAMYSRIFFTGLTLVAALATAVVYGVGGTLAIDGALELGTLVALATLLTRLYGPLTALSNVHVDIMTALVSFDRVFEVLDLRPSITEPVAPRLLPEPAGDQPGLAVQFDQVSFRYPRPDEVSLASLESVAVAEPNAQANEAVHAPVVRPHPGGEDLSSGGAISQADGAGGPAANDTDVVLRQLSFTAEPGEMVALVGPSGAGKTTVTHLVARLYDPGSGTVRLGGVDVRELDSASLRAAVGVVTQEAHLLHDTVAGNLRYAHPEASDAELYAALRSARLGSLLEELPDGLDTVVGDRGYRLSGGEKQRLAIARLLLKQPAVVVLDEATAHLDAESEQAVQQALTAALRGRTSLVIAHRLATVREADRILVLDGGRIVEQGTHEELLRGGGLYAELYRTQFALQE